MYLERAISRDGESEFGGCGFAGADILKAVDCASGTVTKI
jgi:hypothetical protein